MPVCSPGLKKELGAAADAKLLAQARLIHITSVANDWSHWFRASGMEVPSSLHGGLRVDTVQMGFDAAMRGLGVVLGRRPLVDDDIESGRLVPLVGQAIVSDSGYWLVTATDGLSEAGSEAVQAMAFVRTGRRDQVRASRFRARGRNPVRRLPVLLAGRHRVARGDGNSIADEKAALRADARRRSGGRFSAPAARRTTRDAARPPSIRPGTTTSKR